MAHGDFTEPVSGDDAAEILVLMAELLHEVFQQDARVARLRAAREAKKSQPALSEGRVRGSYRESRCPLCNGVVKERLTACGSRN
jgi:hypothetical protein